MKFLDAIKSAFSNLEVDIILVNTLAISQVMIHHTLTRSRSRSLVTNTYTMIRVMRLR